jgi:hypothetical protein
MYDTCTCLGLCLFSLARRWTPQTCVPLKQKALDLGKCWETCNSNFSTLRVLLEGQLCRLSFEAGAAASATVGPAIAPLPGPTTCASATQPPERAAANATAAQKSER